MSEWKPSTPEDLIEELRECVERGLYFEICPENAKVLYDHIENLRRAAEDDRGVL